MTELHVVSTALSRLDAMIGRRVDGDPRAAFAQVIGLASAGVRATVCVDTTGLGACTDLVGEAVERRLALVIRVAAADGDGVLLAASDRGAAVLVATDLQEAFDLTLVARRAAERTLLPVIVACDLDLRSVHDAEFPSAAVVRRSIGAADDRIGCLNAEQRMLFGDRRRRLVRWFDLERPVMTGARVERNERLIRAASLEPFAIAAMPAALEEAFVEISRATGRPLQALGEHALDEARGVIVATGSAFGVAVGVVDHLRASERQHLGVLALRVLRPFPAALVTARLRGCHEVVLIERGTAPLADDPPLARELGAAMRRAIENGQRGRRSHRDLPAWRAKDDPTLHVAIVGAGALSAADLMAFCREAIAGDGRTQARLGVDFAPGRSTFPKRQALLDRIAREHPGIGVFGFRASGPVALQPVGTVTADIARADLPAAAAILQALVGGGVRSIVYGDRARLAVGPRVRTLAGDAAIEVVVASRHGVLSLEPRLARGAAIVIPATADEPITLPEALTRERFVALYRAPVDWPDARLGALVGALQSMRGGLDVRRAIAAFEALCGGDGKRVAAFRAAVELTHELVNGERKIVNGVEPPRAVPRLLLPLARTSAEYDGLPRFWDQVGVLHELGALDELSPDPYAAVATIPPLSAGIRLVDAAPDAIPEFDPLSCTGCGACWSACPDGAIGPLAATPRHLLEACLDAAARVGRPADALRPMVGKLGARLRAGAEPRLGAALRIAYDEVIAKSPPTPDRRAVLDAALAAVCEVAGELSLAGAAESFAKTDGTLLSLALDPDACKACAVCVEVCEPGAFRREPRTPERIAAARATQRLWEALPDTRSETIAALREHGAVSTASALGLSRHGLLPMAPGDRSESGSGPRLAVRLALGALEARGQPQLRERILALDALRDRFGAAIREVLGAGLPTADLDALAEGLDALGRRDLQLADLAQRVDSARDGGRVDGARLDRLVHFARDLADRRFALETGTSGLGCSRASIAVVPTDSLAWAGTAPWNPFAMPTGVDTMVGDVADLARGLCEGQVDAYLDEVRAIRGAAAELERSPTVHVTVQAPPIGWTDLSPAERAACPPLVLIATARALGGRALGGIAGLLRSDLPLVVLAIADGDRDEGADLVALARREPAAFVVQTSIASPDALVDGMRDAARTGRPSLVHVLAPSPARLSSSPAEVVATAAAIVASGAFRTFVADPAARPRAEPAAPPADAPGAPEQAPAATSSAVERAAIERELEDRLQRKLTVLALRGMT